MPNPTTSFSSQFPTRYDDANLQFEIDRTPDPNVLEGRDYNIHDVELAQIQRVIGTGYPTGTLLHMLSDLENRINDVAGTTGAVGTLLSEVSRDVTVHGNEWTFGSQDYLDDVLNDVIEQVEAHRHIGGSGNSFSGYPIAIIVDNDADKSFTTLNNRTLGLGQNKSTIAIGASGFTAGSEASGVQGDLDDLFTVKAVDSTGNPQLMLNVHDQDGTKNQPMYAGLTQSSAGNQGIGLLGGEDGVLFAPDTGCIRHRRRQNSDGTWINEGHLPHSVNFYLDPVLDGPLAFASESRSASGFVPTGQFFDTPRDEFSDYYVAPLVFMEQNRDYPGNGTPYNTGEWGTFWREKDYIVSETGMMTGSASTATYVMDHYPRHVSITVYGDQNIVNQNNVIIQWNWPGGNGGQGARRNNPALIHNQPQHAIPGNNPQQNPGGNDINLKIPIGDEKGPWPDATVPAPQQILFNPTILDYEIATPDLRGDPRGSGTVVRELFETWWQDRIDDLQDGFADLTNAELPIGSGTYHYGSISTIAAGRGAVESEAIFNAKTNGVKDFVCYSTNDFYAIFYNTNTGTFTFANPIVFEGPQLLPNTYRIVHGETPAEHTVVSSISTNHDSKIVSVQITPDFEKAVSAGGASPTFRLATYVGATKYFISNTIIPPDWHDVGEPRGVGTFTTEINRFVPAGCPLILEVIGAGTLPFGMTGMPYKFLFTYEHAFARLPQATI